VKKDPKNLLLVCLVIVAFIYRISGMLLQTFPPGADIGLHNSIVHSITQSGNTNFLWNYYHMGGGSSDTFPGYHIFTAGVILLTGLPDYLAQALVASAFSSLLVAVAFLLTRKVWNASAALIVAFLIAVSRFDFEILMWGGYPNIVTLTLIPVAFYMFLEKERFSTLPFLMSASLVSAAIFLTHSLSAVLFVTITLAVVFVAVVFSKQVGTSRAMVLTWVLAMAIGALAVSPFLFQVAQTYSSMDSAVLTGGIASVQQAVLSTRLISLDVILPLFAFVFLFLLFSKHYTKKYLPISTLLLVLWWLIPTALTQTYLVGFYTDYQRFLYFILLPVILLIGLGIYHCAKFFATNLDALLSINRQTANENRDIQWIRAHATKRNLKWGLTTIFIISALLVPIFATPSLVVSINSYYQIMDDQKYAAIQWAKTNTPADSVFLADATYGWWFSGFAQRRTYSAVDPQYLTSSREVGPAVTASRILDTDYLVDNGLIQVREDGGYIGRHNPEFLAKLNSSYLPYPFFNFDNSEITVTLRNNGNVSTVNLAEIPLTGMHMENNSNSASIYISWGNSLLNFTQKTTVYQGVRFVNMTQTLSSSNSTVTFDTVNLILHTKGTLVQYENSSTAALVDTSAHVAGQLIFTQEQPIINQITKDPSASLGLLYNLNAQSKAELNFYVGVYEYPSNLDVNSQPNSGIEQLMGEYAKTYMDKTADFPLDVFDYRQATASLNASYVIIMDAEQLPRFTKDPLFTQVFVNSAVAIFKVQNTTQ
jgi:hypothetical protein